MNFKPLNDINLTHQDKKSQKEETSCLPQLAIGHSTSCAFLLPCACTTKIHFISK